jgi:hypothetical protein
MKEIPNNKIQMTNKPQFRISNAPNKSLSDIGHWCLFGIQHLEFGAS